MRSWRLALWLAVLTACSFGQVGEAAELRAGVARVDLTPPAELNAALGGYGARMSRPAEGVHDRVLAKALVISDGTGRFALVTAGLNAGGKPSTSASSRKSIPATPYSSAVAPPITTSGVELNSRNPAPKPVSPTKSNTVPCRPRSAGPASTTPTGPIRTHICAT